MAYIFRGNKTHSILHVCAVCYADLSGSVFICEGIYINSASTVKCKIRLRLPASKFWLQAWRKCRNWFTSGKTPEPKRHSLDCDVNFKGGKYLQFLNTSRNSSELFVLGMVIYLLVSFLSHGKGSAVSALFSDLLISILSPLFFQKLTVRSRRTWERATFLCTIHRGKNCVTSDSCSSKVWKARVSSREVSSVFFYAVIIVWFLPSSTGRWLNEFNNKRTSFVTPSIMW